MPINDYGFEYESVGPSIAPTAPGVPEEESGFFGEFGKGFVSAFLGVGAGVVGTAEWIVPGQQESWIRAKENIRSAQARYPYEGDSWLAFSGRVIGEALPYMGTAMVAGYATAGIAGGIAGAGGVGLTGQAAAATAAAVTRAAGIGKYFGAAATGFSIMGQQAYDDAKSKGASDNEANAERLIVGTVNAAIEAAQIGRLMKFHDAGALSLKSFIKNVRDKSWDLVGGDAKLFTGQALRTALEEALEEAVQEGVSISVPGFLRGDYPKNEDGTIAWPAIWQQIGMAGLGGGIAGGVLGGAGAFVGASPEIGRPSVANIDAAIEKIKGYDLTDVEKDQWISQMEQLKGTIREPVVSEPVEGVETPYIPKEQENVYKGIESDKIYYEPTGEGAAQTTRMEEIPVEPTKETGPGAERKAIQAYVRDEEGNVYTANTHGEAYNKMQDAGGTEKPIRDSGFVVNGKLIPDLAVNRGELEKQGFVSLPEAAAKAGPGAEAEPETRTRIVSVETGEELIQAPELQRQRGETEEQYLARTQPKPEVKPAPGYVKEYDEQLINSISQLNLELRKPHEAKIKKERGIRFSQARSRLEQELKDRSVLPMATAALVKSELEGELGLRFETLKFNEDQINYYYQRVNISPESKDITVYLNATDGLNKLFGLEKGKEGAGLPEPGEIKALEKIFGPKLAEKLTQLRSVAKTGKPKSWWSITKDLLNFPRALLVSGEMSMVARQGLLLMPIAPKQWFKAAIMGWRSYLSPEYTNFVELQIKSHPLYPMFKKHKGHFSVLGSLTEGEEFWSSSLAQKIVGVKASERGATTFLNAFRFYTAANYYQDWMGAGASSKDYDLLTGFINHATGRGDVKGLEKYIPTLNIGFFSPRYTLSRPQAIADLFKGLRSVKEGGKITEKGELRRVVGAKGIKAKWEEISPARKIIARDLVRFFVGGSLALYLLSLIKGVKVEKDPRSSDFGKVRFGNTRIDFWGGYSQIARLMAQLAVAESKGVDSGRIMKAERGDIIGRYLQTKLSPAAGLSLDLLRGETFLGEKLEISPEVVTKQIYERFTPLFIQDITEAFRFQGVTSGMIAFPLTFHGIGMMTYPKKAGSESIRIRDTISRETFGMGWDDVGPEGQRLLRQSRPEIELSERQARIEREDFDSSAKRLEEQQKAMKNIVKKLPQSVRDEITEINAYLPGLNRYISNGWYLNDKRYSEYQKKTEMALSLYLSKLISLPMYRLAPPEMRAVLLEEIVKDVKQSVRDKLVMDATIADFERLRK